MKFFRDQNVGFMENQGEFRQGMIKYIIFFLYLTSVTYVDIVIVSTIELLDISSLVNIDKISQ